MSLHPIDLGILVVYFAAMIVVGFALEKRASRGLDSYFLGSNRMPWWLLSLSNATSMFDISGALPIYVVIRKSGGIIVSAILVVLSMVILKKTWYDRLERKGTGAEA
jgi:hypothetical protein